MPTFVIRATWRGACGAKGYLVGIAFTDEQTLFSARMGEQVCQIERYCRMHDTHDDLQEIQAVALQWVEQHADEFSHDSVRKAFAQPALD